ncbi:polysaccharide deacetylase family protein [Botryobacter ruber]|uniref:polysaccharide deacetylase family protein n=1 Tax=Botryobacter ruber TaxID=2171629 RepID=UPI000E0AFD2E|nr:polysaccharide deacetylase family protein [Botryobacter ruber]
MDAAINYILSHFHRLYPQAAAVPVAWGTEAAATGVCIRKYSGDFFQQQSPHPLQVVWKEWQGKQVPFFFEEDAEPELISYYSGSATINYDIISSAFYLLSGWQEYHSTTHDSFGRFPYSASMQAKHGFLTKPVVNYYFGILKETMEKSTRVRLVQKQWPGQKSFATCLTHDIDRINSAWKVAGVQRLKKGQLLPFAKLALRKLSGKDAWHNIPELMVFAADHHLKATFFWMANSAKYHGHPNSDYDVASPENQRQLQSLLQAGHEVGLHGGFGTSASVHQLQQEAQELSVPVHGNRFHYLSYAPRTTPQVLDESGLRYDTTLGFAEHVGFRNSFCHPFYPFDFKSQRAHRFLELPLCLMDTTLYNPQYMHLRPSEVLPLLRPMLQEIKEFGGLLTLLWHNENLSDYPERPLPEQERQWWQVLQSILEETKAQGSTFLTCSEAADVFSTTT